MATRKSFSGAVSSVSYSTKHNAYILRTKSEQVVVVGQKLMQNIAMSQGLTLPSLLRSLSSSHVSCDLVSVKKDEIALNNQGKPQLDKLGQPIRYTQDHVRYQNVEINVSERRLRDIEMAQAYGEVMAAMFDEPIAPTPKLSSAPKNSDDNLTEDIIAEVVETEEIMQPAEGILTEEPQPGE